MVQLVSCIIDLHNPWLIAVAALVCGSGAWAIIRLVDRAATTQGLQRSGWQFLAALTAGTAIWCSHFVAMLGYDPSLPVTFDALLTVISLLVAVGGSLIAFALVTSPMPRMAPVIGGVALGLAISAMHYTGIMAYRVQGVVRWDRAYVVASILFAVVLSALSMHLVARRRSPVDPYAAAIVLTLAILGLHFAGMTAMRIDPMFVGIDFTDPRTFQAVALSVASVGLIVIGGGLTSYLIDDSTRAQSFIQLRHLALNDPLTGLPNRRNFTERLDRELAHAANHGGQVAMIAIDLNRFKDINDVNGHSAGDEVLQVLAQRMRATLRGGEIVARVGGDEFFAMQRVYNPARLKDFLSRLESALTSPVMLGADEAKPSASLGVAVYPDDAFDKETLLSNADLAMYRAKADLGRNICFYEASMDETIRLRRAMAHELRTALERGELELHYQVQVSVATGRVTGYEALLRWNHAVRGQIPPCEFIPVAEENGLILQLGEWALRRACRDAAGWEKKYKVSVNLSPVQFAHVNLPKLVHEILLETGLPPKRLELELTETAVMADRNRSLMLLRQIKALGVGIALDDFGTGYSSLDTLQTYPFDKIKLDRSFMREVETSPQAKAIIRAVLALGKSLNIAVLAEGVENPAQLEILRNEGCDKAQGYLLGRPARMCDIPALRSVAADTPEQSAATPAAAKKPAVRSRPRATSKVA